MHEKPTMQQLVDQTLHAVFLLTPSSTPSPLQMNPAGLLLIAQSDGANELLNLAMDTVHRVLGLLCLTPTLASGPSASHPVAVPADESGRSAAECKVRRGR
jgi:hypothetical protein